jgi:hypothetical protein
VEKNNTFFAIWYFLSILWYNGHKKYNTSPFESNDSLRCLHEKAEKSSSALGKPRFIGITERVLEFMNI